MTEGVPGFLRRLEDGLIMRRATSNDAAQIAKFNSEIHGEDKYDARAVSTWTSDLLTLPHPTVHSEDFTVVENPATGEIVSTLCLISQTWAYEQVPFKVGRPELVGTLPGYRNRGLVRAQFETIHEWSQQRYEPVQMITGIPNYYRQFGYEMTLELSGGQGGYEAQVPFLAEGQEEKFLFRPADEVDIPWLVQLYNQECSRSAISVPRSNVEWSWELSGKSSENANRLEFRIIETREGLPVGYIAYPWYVWGNMQAALRYELVNGFSYLDVTPAVLRYLWKIGRENAQQREKTLSAFGLWFGSTHPAYLAIANRLVIKRPPYAFYVRVPDLPAFLSQITPALEKRLKESICNGYSGELKISFYRRGMRMVFENGALLKVEPWKPVIQSDEGSAAFPNLTFLQLIFGSRSLDEIKYAYPDCWTSEDAGVLLNGLFPKKPSSIWPIS